MVGQHAERKPHGKVGQHDLRGGIAAVEGIHAVLVQVAGDPVGLVQALERKRAQVLCLAVGNADGSRFALVFRTFGELQRILAKRQLEGKTSQHISIDALQKPVACEHRLSDQPAPVRPRDHARHRRGLHGLG